MEVEITDPSVFDVYAKIQIDSAKQAAEWISVEIGVSRLEIFKIIAPLIKRGDYVSIHTGYGWDEIPQLMSQLPGFVIQNAAIAVENGCSPNSESEYCEKHTLFHCFGECPVCADSYIKKGGQ